MALIGQIREKSWLLIVVVGVAMLAFILPWDQIFNGGQSRTDDYGIGTVNGEKINSEQYEQYKNTIGQNMFNSKRQQDPNVTGLSATDIKNVEAQAWNAVIGRKLSIEQYEKLGLTVSPYELDGLLYGTDGFEPSPMMKQVAVDSNGLFNSQKAQMILQDLEQRDPKQYDQVLSEIKMNRLNEKYLALLNTGVVATTLEAKDAYESGKTVKNVSFIFKRFTDMPASEIEVTDEEIEAYYNEHKNDKKFEQKGMRKISYFTVPILPSAADTSSAMRSMSNLRASFAKAKNDSLFVRQYNQTASVNEVPFYPEETYTNPQQPTLFYPEGMDTLKVGDVVGPIKTKTFVGVAKVKSLKEEKQAHVRHILISASKDNSDEYEKARIKADSIKNVIINNNNFVEMEAEFNQDPGGKQNHGVYKNFPEGVMVTEFNDFAFNQSVGTIDIVGTDYGYHVVEVMGQRTVPVYGMFAINRPVNASPETVSKRKTEARRMISDLDKTMKNYSVEERTAIFDSLVRTLGYSARLANILDDSPAVTALGSQGEGQLIKLAFKDGNEPGLLNPYPIKDDNKLVVAYYGERIESGVPSLASIKKRLEYEVTREKQGDLILEEFKAKSEGDIDIASKALGLEITQQGITFDATNVTGAGNAPIFVGTVFSGLQDGQTTVPFKGKTGVFMVRIDNTVPAPETTDYSTEKAAIQSANRGNVVNKYQNALIDNADVIDNRKLRSLGLR